MVLIKVSCLLLHHYILLLRTTGAGHISLHSFNMSYQILVCKRSVLPQYICREISRENEQLQNTDQSSNKEFFLGGCGVCHKEVIYTTFLRILCSFFKPVAYVDFWAISLSKISCLVAFFFHCSSVLNPLSTNRKRPPALN